MYTIQERVGASRTDQSGKLKLAAALDLLQDCSMHWIESEPVFMEYLRRNNIAMLLASRQADVVRLPVYGERVTVKTSVYECRSFYGFRNTAIYGEDGAPCVLTWSTGAFVRRTAGTMARLPQEVTDAVTYDEKLDMAYLDKKIALPETAPRRPDPFPVRRGDIDLNGHMNNARYVEHALELLPAGFEFRRLRIEYKNAALPGALLYPRLYESDDTCCAVLADGGDRPYTVMEFRRR